MGSGFKCQISQLRKSRTTYIDPCKHSQRDQPVDTTKYNTSVKDRRVMPDNFVENFDTYDTGETQSERKV
jgi:hypothetical protein